MGATPTVSLACENGAFQRLGITSTSIDPIFNFIEGLFGFPRPPVQK